MSVSRLASFCRCSYRQTRRLDRLDDGQLALKWKRGTPVLNKLDSMMVLANEVLATACALHAGHVARHTSGSSSVNTSSFRLRRL